MSARTFDYWCPACGQHFSGPYDDTIDTPAQAACDQHCRSGLVDCRLPLLTPTPIGFHWDCAACGVVCDTLLHAQLHTLEPCPNDLAPHRLVGMDRWACCGEVLGRQQFAHARTCWWTTHPLPAGHWLGRRLAA